MGETNGKPIIRPLRENEKGPEFPGLSASCRILHKIAVPPTGVEQSQDSPGISGSVAQSDALSDARGVLCHVDDVRLARLIDVWPALEDAVKGEILTLAGSWPTTLTTGSDVTG